MLLLLFPLWAAMGADVERQDVGASVGWVRGQRTCSGACMYRLRLEQGQVFFLLLLSLFVFTGSAYMEVLPSGPSYFTLVYCCLACAPSVFASSRLHAASAGGNAATCFPVLFVRLIVFSAL